MSDTAAIPNRAKKGVGLSGVTAGNTALCTVGRTGNDLHYRGYDILDVAETCEFEEIAYLLVHGTLPTRAELARLQGEAARLRGLPASVKQTLEALPPAAHPMDVMRTAVSALGCVLPEKDDQNPPGARDIVDRLMASLGSMLLYWFHYAHNGKRIDVETDDDSIGGHFLHLLHGKPPSEMFVRAMHTSLILYAEHEFNASTFTCRVVGGHRRRHVFGDHRRHRRAARAEAWRRQRGLVRDPEPLRRLRMKRKPTSAGASPTARWSSASAMRSIRSPIRATR